MIVVFVVDTSPSMALKLDIGMSKLDLAKMAVESISKGLTKRVHEHNSGYNQAQQSLHNMGIGFCPPDQFLLLSTGRQYDNTASCGAGGRLLVGFGDYYAAATEDEKIMADLGAQSHQAFERELKKLKATTFQDATKKFPDSGGGAVGMNAALSAGLSLLSRYRYKSRSTENFGMGRLPSPAMLLPSGGAAATNALQPACLVFLTDGECLKPKVPGGGKLEVQFGNIPLREFYQEPFRWDQRIFVLGVGNEQKSSTQFLHPSIRVLCEVTGGCHAMVRSTTALPTLTDLLIKIMAPPRPLRLPIADPLRLNTLPPPPHESSLNLPYGTFVRGGPICCFQSLEAGPNGEISPTHRAMLLYVPYQQPLLPPQSSTVVQPPTWCLPEAFFPSKKLDTLPPRLAQPLLTFSRNFSIIGSTVFDPAMVMKALHRLDQLIVSNCKPSVLQSNQQQNQTKLLQRDTYICEWVSQDGRPTQPPRGRTEYFPAAVRGAGRSMSEGEEPILNIGILHVPNNSSTLLSPSLSSSSNGFCTLTLLPPEPHILLPLLIRAAEAEHHMLKKNPDKPRAVLMDESWRSEFRAYMFRIPPYYHNALKRFLRPLLPNSVHTLLSSDGIESLASQCFSKTCLQKIRAGANSQKEHNKRLEQQERELRQRGVVENVTAETFVGYGQYDARGSSSSYLSSLKMLPAPWKLGIGRKTSGNTHATKKDDGTNSDIVSTTSGLDSEKPVTEILGDLPSECLVPYYESRRRWLFGGSGLTTRNVFVEGVCNDGSNSQRCSNNPQPGEQLLIALAGVGVSMTNEMPTVKMGDYRERLLWTRAPIVGYGSNDCTGVAVTTAANGSPKLSVDNDAMPISFFDPKTGEFIDSVQTRVKSRLTVHFGNPFKDKRGDTIVPEAFLNQRPPRRVVGNEDISGPTRPPGSPPHDNFSSVEGEGEAAFASPTRKSPQHPTSSSTSTPTQKKRDASQEHDAQHQTKRPKMDDSSSKDENESNTLQDKRPATPEAPPKPPSTSSRPQPPASNVPPAPRPPAPPLPPAVPPVPPSAKQKKLGAPPPPKPRPPGPPPGGKPKPPQRSSVAAHPPPPKTKPPKPPNNSTNKEMNPPRAPSSHPPSQRVPPPGGPPPTQKSTAPSKKLQVPEEIPLKSKPHTAPPPPMPKATTALKKPPTVPNASAVVETASEVESPDKEPDVNLPPGWMAVWSKSQKRWYYFDKKTKRSVWQWPPPN